MNKQDLPESLPAFEIYENKICTCKSIQKPFSPTPFKRICVTRGLYEWLLNKDDAPAIIEHIRQAHGFDKADTEHFVTLVSGTIHQAETLRSRKSCHTSIVRWMNCHRSNTPFCLSVPDGELGNHIEIPYRVVINEAVELTKSFGGIDGHKFVNGVLDKIAAKLRPEEVEADRKK